MPKDKIYFSKTVELEQKRSSGEPISTTPTLILLIVKIKMLSMRVGFGWGERICISCFPIQHLSPQGNIYDIQRIEKLIHI